jgi:hypothetical protein
MTQSRNASNRRKLPAATPNLEIRYQPNPQSTFWRS